MRTFIAVWPPPEVVDVLAALDRPPLPDVRWSAPKQWAVKIRPLGHISEREVAELRTVLEAEIERAAAVDCVLGPATRRLGGQWLGAPVTGLEELAAFVFAATEDLVPVTHPQPFQVHRAVQRAAADLRHPAGLGQRRWHRPSASSAPTWSACTPTARPWSTG